MARNDRDYSYIETICAEQGCKVTYIKNTADHINYDIYIPTVGLRTYKIKKDHHSTLKHSIEDCVGKKKFRNFILRAKGQLQ